MFNEEIRDFFKMCFQGINIFGLAKLNKNNSISIILKSSVFMYLLSTLKVVINTCRLIIISLQCRRPGFDPWVQKIPRRREQQLTPVFLPGEFHGQKSLVGYSPWGHKASDTTKQLTLSLYSSPISMSSSRLIPSLLKSGVLF